MKYDPLIHHRRSIRLKEYDYSQPGTCFVTIVTKERINIFGSIVNEIMKINRYGEIVQKVWEELPCHYGKIDLDYFVIMPNHIHGIIIINSIDAGRGGSSFDMSKPTSLSASTFQYPHHPLETRPYIRYMHGLPEIVRAFKTYSARKINNIRRSTGHSVWQRNYYERIIRNQRELDSIRAYIENYPRSWMKDEEYHA